MVGARLDDGHLVGRRQAQQGFRHPDVVVEVAFRGQDAEALAQHGCDELLGGCFPVRPGHLHHRRAEPAAVKGCQPLQGSEGVGHVEQPLVAPDSRIVDDGVGATGFQGFQGKGVAVERGSAQGEEYRTGRAVARVGRHHRMVAEKGV